MRRKPGVTSETVDGEAVLIGPDAKEVIALNAVGTLVWEALASPRDADDVVDELAGTFENVGRDELQR
ncbi:MAG: PqqD family protein, partial [Acidimicrobiales bacterium]|nr:PqqD family protein [Acidimicrobiales bacterium]